MPFAQNTYWGSAAGEAANILWELIWDQHGFIFGIGYLAWKIYQQYRVGGISAVITHVKDLWWSFQDVALPICRALLVAFLLLMFAWVPYQRARNEETSHADQITKLELEKNKVALEKDAEIHRLNSENVGLTEQLTVKGNADQIDKAQKEQMAKERREQAIADKCFNKPLEFKQVRIKDASPPKEIEVLFYAQQIKLWPQLGPSETGRIRVHGNVPFTGPAEPRDVIKTLATNGISADYDVYPTISKRTSVQFIIYSANPFRVECIDKLPTVK